MKNILILFIHMILFLNIYSCEDITNSPDGTGINPEYVPGQVLVGFVDTVSYDFIIYFFDTLSLEILDLDLGHNFKAKADSNNLEFYRKIFSNDSTIEFIDQLPSSSTPDSLHITMTFNGMNTLEADLIKVESIGLNVYDISRHPKTVQLRCEIGEENYWISRLLTYDFVRYVEFNYLNHIHKN